MAKLIRETLEKKIEEDYHNLKEAFEGSDNLKKMDELSSFLKYKEVENVN